MKRRISVNSTRVSNELGAGNPDKAKQTMATTLKLSVVLALLIVLALATGHDIWAGFFTDDLSIIKAFASMTPFLAISIALDAFQVVFTGFKDPISFLICSNFSILSLRWLSV
jgi:MATE family multidrug resistance protein